MAAKVKICGLTNLADAQRAADLGAWGLGLIFHPQSPRRCREDEAVAIAAALRRRAEICGVFVNRPLDEVVAAADRIGLTMLQLHGVEAEPGRKDPGKLEAFFASARGSDAAAAPAARPDPERAL